MSADPIVIPPIDWSLLAPFVSLVLGGIAVTLMAVGPPSWRRHTGHAALLVLVPPAWFLWRLGSSPGGAVETMSGMVVMDHFSIGFHALFLLTAALALLLAVPVLADARRQHGGDSAEYDALVLFATAGMMLMSSSTNLLILFLGLEVLSLPLYVLVGFSRTQDRSMESSVKYFLLGAFSTGFTIYGMALMYAATGTLDLSRLPEEAAEGSTLLMLGFGLTLVGFLFKIAAFPFHFWLPDVYQGAPTSVTAFMIAGTKAAAFAAVLRLVTSSPALWEGPVADEWARLLSVLAMLTMTAGNVVALVQTDIKRMLACSSIAHAGYLMIAVVTRSGDGVAGVLYYLAAYLFMNLGAFAVVLAIDRARGSHAPGDPIASYAGLARRHPLLAAAMALFMLSLTGVPLTGGFLGKFYIFSAAIEANLYPLAAVGLLNSALAAAYYLNVILVMYMREPQAEAPGVRLPLPLGAGIALSAAGVIYLGIFPGRFLEFARTLLL
ncbi:MAG TPA: NADH-quinone oxidoreductase subunit N [Candidatus Polarisedimenticolia bacterium]|nr:NADH-quinone oxidoreductase subunit N [Candidatus Polarisedimenticolia bacterium]